MDALQGKVDSIDSEVREIGDALRNYLAHGATAARKVKPPGTKAARDLLQHLLGRLEQVSTELGGVRKLSTSLSPPLPNGPDTPISHGSPVSRPLDVSPAVPTKPQAPSPPAPEPESSTPSDLTAPNPTDPSPVATEQHQLAPQTPRSCHPPVGLAPSRRLPDPVLTEHASPLFSCTYQDVNVLNEVFFEECSRHPIVKDRGYFKLQVHDLPALKVEKMARPSKNHVTSFCYKADSRGSVKVDTGKRVRFSAPRLPFPRTARTNWSFEEQRELWNSTALDPPKGTRPYIIGNPLFEDAELSPGEKLRQRGRGALEGINTQYVYFNLTGKTITTMHREDAHVRSENLLRSGENKFWCFVKPGFSAKLEEQLRLVYPGMRNCSQAVRHLSLHIPPARLDEWGVEYTLDYCVPGQAVVTEPGTYHQVLNLGPNYAVAINVEYLSSPDEPINYRFCDDACPDKFAMTAEDFKIHPKLPLVAGTEVAAVTKQTDSSGKQPAAPLDRARTDLSLPEEGSSASPERPGHQNLQIPGALMQGSPDKSLTLAKPSPVQAENHQSSQPPPKRTKETPIPLPEHVRPKERAQAMPEVRQRGGLLSNPLPPAATKVPKPLLKSPARPVALLAPPQATEPPSSELQRTAISSLQAPILTAEVPQMPPHYQEPVRQQEARAPNIPARPTEEPSYNITPSAQPVETAIPTAEKVQVSSQQSTDMSPVPTTSSQTLPGLGWNLPFGFEPPIPPRPVGQINPFSVSRNSQSLGPLPVMRAPIYTPESFVPFDPQPTPALQSLEKSAFPSSLGNPSVSYPGNGYPPKTIKQPASIPSQQVNLQTEQAAEALALMSSTPAPAFPMNNKRSAAVLPAKKAPKKQKTDPAPNQQASPVLESPAATMFKKLTTLVQSTERSRASAAASVAGQVSSKAAFHRLDEMVKGWRGVLWALPEGSTFDLINKVDEMQHNTPIHIFLRRLSKVILADLALVVGDDEEERHRNSTANTTVLLEKLHWKESDLPKLQDYIREGKCWKTICNQNDGLLCIMPLNADLVDLAMFHDEVTRFHQQLGTTFIRSLGRMGKLLQQSIFNVREPPEFVWEAFDTAHLSPAELEPFLIPHSTISKKHYYNPHYPDWPRPRNWRGAAWPSDPLVVCPGERHCNMCKRKTNCQCVKKYLPDIPRVEIGGRKGEGVRSIGRHPAGQILGELLGELTPIGSHPGEGTYVFCRPDMDNEAVTEIFPGRRGNWVRKVHHSEDPSTELRPIKIMGRWRAILVTLRDLQDGEEITLKHARDFSRPSDVEA